MAIKDGQVASADEVMDAFGLLFSNSIQGFFNADYDGFNSSLGFTGVPTNTNFKYVAKQSGTNWTTEYDSATTTAFVDGLNAANDTIYSATIVDECDDSSVDTNVWSSVVPAGLTLTENTERLSISMSNHSGSSKTGTVTADQTDATDYKAVTADSEVLVKYVGDLRTPSGSAGNGTVYSKIQITDGSTTVDIITKTLAGDGSSQIQTTTSFLRLVFDKSGEEVHVYENGTEVASSPFDLSALTNYYFQGYINLTLSSGTASWTAQTDIHYLREVTGAGTSKIFQTNATTSTSTITNAILVSNTIANGGTFVHQLSADNGSNWETVTPNKIHRFSNTGTQLKHRVTMTEATTIDETISQSWTPQLNEFAVIYNWY
jgi:hypothetical protein